MLAPQMQSEIERFRALLGVDADRFSALTYQELWQRLAPNLGDEHSSYATYLSDRYFQA
jgi:hypothetical protein